MTAGQQIFEQGRQQGIEQGRQQGIEQGRRRFQESLLRLLRQRFGGAVPPWSSSASQPLPSIRSMRGSRAWYRPPRSPSYSPTEPRADGRVAATAIGSRCRVSGGAHEVLEHVEHVEPEELQRLLERDLGPETKDAIMTAGQQLIEQGRQQGIEQGRQQGRQEFLLRQLRQRFGGAVNAVVEQRIATATVEEIETWSVRVLAAATLPELFAD